MTIGRNLFSPAVPELLFALDTFAIVLWTIAYALTRTRNYRFGMRLACVGGVVVTLISMVLRSEPWMFTNVALLVGVGGGLLGRRDALALAGLGIVGLFVSAYVYGVPQGRGELTYMAFFVFFVVGVLEFAVAFRGRLDHERQQQVVASEERYRSLFELAFDGVVFVRGDEILESNRGFSRMTGRPRDALVGKPLGSVIEITGRAATRPVSSVETAVREGRGKRPNGEPFYVEVVSRPQESRGAIAECIAVRDITERKHAELQLSITHRAVSLGTLAAGVAHEINNPLAWVRTNIEVLQERLSDSLGATWRAEHPTLAQTIDDSVEGVSRVELVVRDLGVLSRDDKDVGVAFVNDALDLAVRMAAKQLLPRAELVRDIGDVPAVRGHHSRLGQVFLNLLTNAAHAFEERRGNEGQDNAVTIAVRSEGDHVIVEITDNGCGIAPELLPHVFDPFFTTKTDGSGTGLGLPISRSIVHALGGQMSVRSELGLGTTFTVELPVSRERPPAAGPEPTVVASVPTSGERASILVLDDEPLVGKSLVRALREHDVTYCERGADAVELLQRQSFDLVLCDLMMPDMTGEDVFEQTPVALRERFVFMTGGAFTSRARSFLERTPNRVLPKPFSTADVRAIAAGLVQARVASARVDPANVSG